MNPLAIIALIQACIAAGTEAATAWTAISGAVAENRDPTAADWAAADLTADQAHAAVQALS